MCLLRPSPKLHHSCSSFLPRFVWCTFCVFRCLARLSEIWPKPGPVGAPWARAGPKLCGGTHATRRQTSSSKFQRALSGIQTHIASPLRSASVMEYNLVRGNVSITPKYIFIYTCSESVGARGRKREGERGREREGEPERLRGRGREIKRD